MFGISVSDSMDRNLVSTYLSNEEMGETESLYTARGDQGMGCMKSMIDDLGIIAEADSFESLVRWHYTNEDQLIGKKETF